MLALRWSDFDADKKTLSISRTLHQLHTGEYVIQPTKSAKGKRVITIGKSTVEILRKHWENQTLMKLDLGSMLQPDDLIFSQWDGDPLRPNTITRAWNNLAKRLGIKVYRLHDARHTHASLMIKQGQHAKVVQERLGHSTISVTMDIYARVTPDLQEQAVKKFDEEVFQSP